MANTVNFDETVSRWANGDASTEVGGKTVREALLQVARAYPSFRLFNCEGELRSIVKVSRNDVPAGLDDALDAADTLRLSVGT